MQWLVQNYALVLQYGAYVVAAASVGAAALAPLTSNKVDDEVASALQKAANVLHKVLAVLGLNVLGQPKK